MSTSVVVHWKVPFTIAKVPALTMLMETEHVMNLKCLDVRMSQRVIMTNL